MDALPPTSSCDASGASLGPLAASAELLEEAVRHGALASIGPLLLLGANPDGSPELHRSLVALAVESGRLEVLEALLAAGASPDALNASNIPALSLAINTCRLDIAELLLYHGASPDPDPCQVRHLPLWVAIRCGELPSLRLLLARGARLDIVDHWGRTPLMMGVQMGRGECVRACLDFGADIDAQDFSGKTAAMLGLNSSAGAMLALCEHGFDGSLLDLRGGSFDSLAASIHPLDPRSPPGAQAYVAWRLAATETEAIADSAPPPGTARSAPRI